MFLRTTKRFKDGKEHRYWSIVPILSDDPAHPAVQFSVQINRHGNGWVRAYRTSETSARRAEIVAY
jgi:hypothetical protein